MVKNFFLLLYFFIGVKAFVFAQDAPALVYSFPSHNNLQFNRFLLNPTFSYTTEKTSYVSLYHRNQWLQFDDSPKVYMASYSSSLTDKTGLAFGIYQQKEGVLTSWGGIANYAYKVTLNEKMNLLLGFNFAYYNSGIDKTGVIAEEPDPFIMAARSNSLLSIKPGVSLQYGNFDFGVYAENYIDYDFKTSEMANAYARKTLVGHAFYRSYHQKEGLFGTNVLTLGIRAVQSEERDLSYNGILLAEFPRLGWVQTSIDKFYGVSFGFGIHLTKRLSLGYTFEKGISEGLSNFGPTHEIVMALAFQDRNLKFEIQSVDNQFDEVSFSEQQEQLDKKQQEEKEDKEEKEASITVEKENQLKKIQQKENEIAIANFKKQIDSEYWPLLEVIANDTNFSTIELQEKFKNISDYIQRMESNKSKITFTQTSSLAEVDKEIKALFNGKNQTLRETPKFGNQLDIPEMEKGIYIISNVFHEQENAEKFILSLRNRGIEANYFINPRNNLRYVYLKQFTNWKEALRSYYSNVNNTYFDTIWILEINMNDKNKK